MNLEQMIAEMRKDPGFARAYDRRAPDFEIARTVIRRRRELGLTQAQLAEKVGTKQASISRLENAVGHPSLSFLTRVAEALNARVHVTLESKADQSTTGQSSADSDEPMLVASWPVRLPDATVTQTADAAHFEPLWWVSPEDGESAAEESCSPRGGTGAV